MAKSKGNDVLPLPQEVPVTERIAHYREMSAQAFIRAANARDPDAKAGQLSVALAYERLAVQVERQSNAGARDTDPDEKISR